jgi:plastocyanin
MNAHRTSRIVATLLALGLLVAVSAACGRRTKDAAVAIRVFQFTPGTVTVESGATVTWTSEDEILHTVTSGTAPDAGIPGVGEAVLAKPDGRFDGGLEGRGATFSYRFEQRGDYAYYCSIHSGMSGHVFVE